MYWSTATQGHPGDVTVVVVVVVLSSLYWQDDPAGRRLELANTTTMALWLSCRADSREGGWEGAGG